VKDTITEFKNQMGYHPDVYKANFAEFIKINDEEKGKSQL